MNSSSMSKFFSHQACPSLVESINGNAPVQDDSEFKLGCLDQFTGSQAVRYARRHPHISWMHPWSSPRSW
eukprot:6492387-Amphidinium_carterae.3